MTTKIPSDANLCPLCKYFEYPWFQTSCWKCHEYAVQDLFHHEERIIREMRAKFEKYGVNPVG